MSISKYNNEGYPDPTAYAALEIIEQEERALAGIFADDGIKLFVIFQ